MPSVVGGVIVILILVVVCTVVAVRHTKQKECGVSYHMV